MEALNTTNQHSEEERRDGEIKAILLKYYSEEQVDFMFYQAKLLKKQVLGQPSKEGIDRFIEKYGKLWFNVYKSAVDIKRFVLKDKPVMLYRNNVAVHQFTLDSMLTKSTDFITKNIKEFDKKKASRYCLLHDFPEIVSAFWDIPTPAKQELEKKQLMGHIEEIERLSISALIQEKSTEAWLILDWVETSEAELEEIFEMSTYKREIEAQVCWFLDKIEWFMSCLHEVLAWNRNFKTPFLQYINLFKDAHKKYKNIEHLFNSEEDNAWFFDLNSIVALENKVDEFLEKWTPHNSKNLDERRNVLKAYASWIDSINFINWEYLAWIKTTSEKILLEQVEWINKRKIKRVA